MIVLDTNVVSELMRPDASTTVIAWVDRQRGGDLYLSAITVGELVYGVSRLPAGRRRASLATEVDALLAEDFRDRILPYDRIAAEHFGDIAAHREGLGLPISATDAQIAATCRSHGANLATRNVTDFAQTGIDVVDPWHDT